MNCGFCLFTKSERVELVGEKCPTCSTDYSRPATQAEIKQQAKDVKPVIHTAGVGKFTLPTRIFVMRPWSAVAVGPILAIEEMAKAKSTAKLVVSTTVKAAVGDDGYGKAEAVVDGTVDNVAAAKVIEWLKTHGCTSEAKAFGAMSATKVFGPGVASSLAKQGLVMASGNKRGCKYWVSP
jgi:hypothetical protein